MTNDITTLTDCNIRVRYTGAWYATDRDEAHRMCVEMRRRGMPVPSWPGIHEMPEDLAAVTPPGVMLLAVLRAAVRAAGGPVERSAVRMAVAITYPDSAPLAKEWGRDLRHAIASGLVQEKGETLTLGSGPRVDALLATMPEDGPHATHARNAWKVVWR